MRRLRTAFVHFWRGFEPANFLGRFPFLAPELVLEPTEDAAEAELVISSCFPGGGRSARIPDPAQTHGARGLRLFYTAENLRPDFDACDFALSFCRDLIDPRHLRLPNHVGTQHLQGFASDALVHPPADPAALLATKTRFCTYVQGNRVAFRERFVRRLARYREVTCAGPSLNNTPATVDRAGKLALYRESKFAVTFENEAGVGYTSEKLSDALLADCVPIYWGDPTVARDFDPGCFLNLADFPSAEALVERVAELDRDDSAYLEILGAPRYPGGQLPEHADPRLIRAFFGRVADAAQARSNAAARRAA